jgi:hypothetical protein
MFAGIAGMMVLATALETAPVMAELEQARREQSGGDEEAQGARPAVKNDAAQASAASREEGEELHTEIDEFTVNAQYRGAIKKSFKDVGDGKIEYMKTGEDTFRIRVTGLITNPDSREKYDLDLDMSFDLDGSRVEVSENRNRFDDRTEWSRKRIERTLPFLYLVRARLPDGRRATTREYFYKGRLCTIRYGQTERNLEASIYDRDELVGKVFLNRASKGSFAQMEKFRVPAQDDVMVSFIIDR